MTYFTKGKTFKVCRILCILSMIFVVSSASFSFSQELDDPVNIYREPDTEEKMRELLLKELKEDLESAAEIMAAAIDARPEFTKTIVETVLGIVPSEILPRIIETGVKAVPEQTAAIIGSAVSTFPRQAAVIVQSGVLAAPEQTGTVVSIAVANAPEQTAGIVKAGIIGAPGQIGVVVSAAIEAAPTLAPLVVDAAVTIVPSAAVDIVTVATTIAPHQAPRIVGAAVANVPDQATAIVPAAIAVAPGCSAQIIQAAVDGVASIDGAGEIENTEVVTTVTTTDRAGNSGSEKTADTGRQPDDLIISIPVSPAN